MKSGQNPIDIEKLSKICEIITKNQCSHETFDLAFYAPPDISNSCLCTLLAAKGETILLTGEPNIWKKEALKWLALSHTGLFILAV